MSRRRDMSHRGATARRRRGGDALGQPALPIWLASLEPSTTASGRRRGIRLQRYSTCWTTTPPGASRCWAEQSGDRPLTSKVSARAPDRCSVLDARLPAHRRDPSVDGATAHRIDNPPIGAILDEVHAYPTTRTIGSTAGRANRRRPEECSGYR